MRTHYTTLLGLIAVAPALAATGGPDQYGYIWKDSNEPNGPVYSWVDITTTGIPITDLADDNTHGPFVMGNNMPFYWYDVKKVWVGSNGYVAFNGGNIAATFPALPAAGGTDNYVAVFMADLTFTGTGNPGQCFIHDEPTRLVVSWINVPFWSVNAPGYTGSNTFQLILNKQDSTITMQYQSVSGTTGSNGPVIGIESITGSIGLARSQSLMPAAGYAVRFYNPANPLLQVKDASVEWVGEPGTGGMTTTVGATMPLVAQVANTGNQSLDAFNVVCNMVGPGGQTVFTETVAVGPLQPGGNLQVQFNGTWAPTAPGTYRHQVSITGIPGEMVSTNNVLAREVVVFATSVSTALVSWAGPSDDGAGLAWNGGDGGIGVYIMPPFYPCQITGTTVRITSNSGSNFAMMLYDDDGPDGGPGTLLDSTVVQFANGMAGDHVYPLANPVMATGGGYYVAWYMLGPNVNIARDAAAPFSLRCYEVLGGAWAEYRDRTTTDFHLGIRVEQMPFLDVGVEGLIGISNGQQISASTTVQVLLKNYGNMPAGNFPVSYRFGAEQPVTQNYTGANIAPGNAAVFSFAQPYVPSDAGTGQFCAWTSAANDEHGQNDTTCATVNVVAGIQAHAMPQLQVWPNPVVDRLYVQGLPPGGTQWQMRDMRGAMVAQGTVAGHDGVFGLPTSGLAAGSYELRCTGGTSSWRARFVVLR